MTLTFWQLLSLFWTLILAVLLAVFLGAYMVFRTKRDTSDPFLQLRQPQGDASVTTGDFDDGDDILFEREEEEALSRALEQTKRMSRQFTGTAGVRNDDI